MNKVELLEGTLDMLIRRTLLFGPAHGHAIERGSDEVLQVKHGVALPRPAPPGEAESDLRQGGRLGKQPSGQVLQPDRTGRKHLHAENSKWDLLTQAIARIMRLAEDEGQS
jgi:hypothetical protein